MIPAMECQSVKSRIALDKRHGKTTSQAAIDFIRRTCSCVTCSDWRREQRSRPEAR